MYFEGQWRPTVISFRVPLNQVVWYQTPPLTTAPQRKVIFCPCLVVTVDDKENKPAEENKIIEFMFADINMFCDLLRLILARAVRRGLK